MAAQKLLLWPTGAAEAAGWGCSLLPFWGVFLLFSLLNVGISL